MADTMARPKLLFFYGEQSGPSRTVEALLSQILQRRMNHETFDYVRVCADRHPDLVERFRVDVLPTLFVVEGKRVRLRLAGRTRQNVMDAALKPWLH
jgi:thioredoxin-like negative regulator of GroEL